ncbi:hypothetical protein H5410_006666 [Solanum commersonii]|uniref:Uncharacterized protein n=1 Tax=Solanum commersonii TaxID=4109 RepID=A0A9J6AAF8_SOLCO|nr:hypothetical protein H5410_006666 [Solanum commersonii]
MSKASTVVKLIDIDKATQIKSISNTARVEEIVYDNLHLYSNYCKHQGHDEGNCRLILKRNQNNKQIDNTIEVALKDTSDDIEKYQGDAIEILNEKRRVVGIDQSRATALD